MKQIAQAELILHLGAARTGTSALQAALRADVDLLRADGTLCLTPAGFGYRRPDTLRAVTRMVETAAHKTGLFGLRARATARRKLTALLGTQPFRRLILSDENLLGPIFDPTDGRGIYPQTAATLRALSRVTRRDPDRVVLVIRPYDTFLPSAFSMSAAYVPTRFAYDHVPPGLADLTGGWPEVIAAIRSSYPNAALKVLRTDTSTTAEVREALLDGTPAGALSPIERVNASPSRAALQAIAAARSPSKRDIDALIAQHKDSPALQVLSDDAAKTLRARYDAEVARL
jgi:hypothetical protein